MSTLEQPRTKHSPEAKRRHPATVLLLAFGIDALTVALLIQPTDWLMTALRPQKPWWSDSRFTLSGHSGATSLLVALHAFPMLVGLAIAHRSRSWPVRAGILATSAVIGLILSIYLFQRFEDSLGRTLLGIDTNYIYFGELSFLGQAPAILVGELVLAAILLWKWPWRRWNEAPARA